MGTSKKPTARRAEQWAKRISAEMSNSVKSIIATGDLLTNAKKDLHHGEWGRMFEEKLVPFSQRTAQRYIEISANPILSNTTHVSYLPPSWGTLYELSTLPIHVLKNALADGLITPEMARKDVRALLPPAHAGEPEAFHWLDGIERLQTAVERVITEWPADALPHAVKALRDLADIIESETSDVGGGPRADRTHADSHPDLDGCLAVSS